MIVYLFDIYYVDGRFLVSSLMITTAARTFINAKNVVTITALTTRLELLAIAAEFETRTMAGH